MMAEDRSVRETYKSFIKVLIYYSPCSLCHICLGRINALLVVYFQAGQRRIEHADHTQGLFAAAQPVFVVLVQCIHHTRPKGVLLAIGNGFDFSIALRSEEHTSDLQSLMRI